MAGENTVSTLSGMFYEIYASKLDRAVPKSVKLQKDVKFKDDKKSGGTYHQPVMLALEQGFTYAKAGDDAFTLLAAIPAVSKDATILGTQMVLRSRVGYEAAARAATSKQVFEKITSYLVENMWEANKKRLEIMLFHGQYALGKVASNASGVLTITTAEWAPGNWSGQEGAIIEAFTTLDPATATQHDADLTISSVDLDGRTVTVPAGSSTNVAAGDYLFFKGEFDQPNDEHEGFVGLHKMQDTAGTVFGINNSTYSLWKTVEHSAASGALTFAKVNKAMAKGMSKGIEEDVVMYCNPSTWADMLNDEAALRRHNEGGVSMYKVGAEGIEFYTQTGSIVIKASTFVKEGYAHIIAPNYFHRPGATDITFRLPDRKDEFFLHDPSVAAYELRTYSNQALFSRYLGRGVLINNIVNS